MGDILFKAASNQTKKKPVKIVIKFIPHFSTLIFEPNNMSKVLFFIFIFNTFFFVHHQHFKQPLKAHRQATTQQQQHTKIIIIK